MYHVDTALLCPLELLLSRQTDHLCPSRAFARQASAISSEWSSLVSFDPVFAEIFRFCKLTDLSVTIAIIMIYFWFLFRNQALYKSMIK